ncbi:hypothetical protein DL767_003410 [Monosporascus sp. MG133]|nr:hypothetical protein DL767_003410 [Monosporascus sp. MG133]
MPPLRPAREGGAPDYHGILTALLPRRPLLITSLPSLLHPDHDRRPPANPKLEPETKPVVPRLATGVDTVPQGYGNAPSGPAPAAVAGIVLGSVAGFVLLLLLIYFCVNLGAPRSGPTMTTVEAASGSPPSGRSSDRRRSRYAAAAAAGLSAASVSVVSRHSRPRAHRRKSRGHHHAAAAAGHNKRHRSDSQSRSRSPSLVMRRRRDTTTVEMRRARSPLAAPSVRASADQIVVEEEVSRGATSRGTSRGRPVPMPMPPPPPVGRDRRHHRDDGDGDDEVVVIEEHSPPAHKSRRGSRGHHRRRSNERRRSGGGSGGGSGGDGYYRDVDPHRFAGGDAPVRSVSRRGSPSRRYS